MRLSQLIAALQTELEKNGDAEHVALSIPCIPMAGDEPRRFDIFSNIEVLSDYPNYPNGMVYLVAAHKGTSDAPKPKRRARGKAVEQEEPVRQRISHPRPGHTVHRCVG